MTEGNARIVKAGMASFYANDRRDENGQEHEVDVIKCATGFNNPYIPRFPIVGLNGMEFSFHITGKCGSIHEFVVGLQCVSYMIYDR